MLLSGGDCLMVSDDTLEYIFKNLREIPHVEIVRLGSRTPVVMPQRITPELCNMMKKYHPVWFNTHFNSPKEITEEAARRCRAEISHKGKNRTILMPGKLCCKLLKYAKKQKIASGEIFLTKSGKGLSRRQIWREMKGLCKLAGVAPSKVFPHNLRHLFATVFYRACHDIAKLADLLGHSSVDTTRIYLQTAGTEHARQLERLGLVS